MEKNGNNLEEKEMNNEKTNKKKALSREVVSYLIFGVLTTAVGWIVYFAVLLSGKAIFSVSTDPTNARYIAIYITAQIIQWICAVLFAFFTNRKWVFTEADKSKKMLPQLLAFSSGRVLTLLLDIVITFLGGLALSKLLPALNSVTLLGFTFNFNEISAKLVAAVVVIVCNYIFSKLFVFKNKK